MLRKYYLDGFCLKINLHSTFDQIEELAGHIWRATVEKNSHTFADAASSRFP